MRRLEMAQKAVLRSGIALECVRDLLNKLELDGAQAAEARRLVLRFEAGHQSLSRKVRAMEGRTPGHQRRTESLRTNP